MEHEFEKQIRNKIHELSDTGLIPDFDKEKTWLEIESRIPLRKNKSFPLTTVHIAAVAAGVLIGILLWESLYPHSKSEETRSAFTNNRLHEIIKTDTVYITPYTPPPHEKYARQRVIQHVAKMQHNQKLILQPDNTIAHEILEQDTVKTQEEKSGNKEMKTAVTQKIKPIHLLDIDNEERQMALLNNDRLDSRKNYYVVQIPNQETHDMNNTQPTSLLKELIKNK